LTMTVEQTFGLHEANLASFSIRGANYRFIDIYGKLEHGRISVKLKGRPGALGLLTWAAHGREAQGNRAGGEGRERGEGLETHPSAVVFQVLQGTTPTGSRLSHKPSRLMLKLHYPNLEGAGATAYRARCAAVAYGQKGTQGEHGLVRHQPSPMTSPPWMVERA
jgi:hypothetical protein